MEDSGAKVLITSPKLRKKIGGILGELPDLKHVIIVNKNNRDEDPLDEGDISYDEAMSTASEDFEIVRTTEEDYDIMHYTSGTTGKPKGAAHAHRAAYQQYATGKWALDLHPDDIYWCTADPGWVTGTSYGMVAPWTNGVTQIIYEGGFGASGWYRVIDKYKVTVWYTAPTAIRMLMKAGDEVVKRHDLSSLRYITSVGEPLNPEAVIWSERVFGLPFHDTWWQTETGSILISNYPIQDIKPGSMGRPTPGITAGILDDDYNELPAVRRATLPSGPAGPPCSRPTGATRNATTPASRTAGTSPATRPAWTKTATSGSWVGPTTLSTPPATWSGPSKSKAPSSSTPPSPRPVSSASPTP